ncbi:MAG TPA: Gldg family protein [Candidatus Binatia bacterium]|jgi:hypothetical protein|nr:Gldg family protein [Candidatus Binatia bacterium]
MAVSRLWFYHGANRSFPRTSEAGHEPALSESTKAMLERLAAPIEIHYYSLLDPATVPDSMRTFAERVAQLLEQYQQAAKGKIKVSRQDSFSNASANAALADGIKPFNQDKGDACYLGLAVLHNGHKESLPLLSPDWEPALESDLSRAIVRLNEASALLSPAAAPAPIDPAASEEVKRAVPNYATVSMEEGTRVLRQAALTEFAQVAAEMDAKVKDAEQRFLEAQKSQSEPAQQAARLELQQLQAEQNEKLKQIVARSQAQIEALQKLKTSGP